MEDHLKAVVLAAGKGTRLQTEGITLPKVMREANGRPLLDYVLEAISFIDRDDTILVVGYQKELVLSAFPGYPYAEQAVQLGTGHAVMSAEALLSCFDGDVLICYGDMPLLTRETYEALIKAHAETHNDCTILTSVSEEQLPYGRVVRDDGGNFLKIVEDRDCSEEERAIRELNTGLYVFNAAKLLPALKQLKSDNAQGEYYLTDVPAILRDEGARLGICQLPLGDEIIGVNTMEQLIQAEDILRQRGA